MENCYRCVNDAADEADFCPSCVVRENSVPSVREDNGGFGWGLLGFLFPIAGLILYLCWNESRPGTAAAAGQWALIGIVVNIFYLIIMYVG